MSPVSRGRRKKPGSSRKKVRRPARPAPHTGPVPVLPGPRRPGWFDDAIGRVLSGAEGLAAATGPRDLEQRVVELLGAELERSLHGGSGLRWGWWVSEVVDAVVERVVEPQGQRGAAWLLLHGLAAQLDIAPETLADLRRTASIDGEPAWLAGVPRIRATGTVHRLRDAYGTRFGVIAEYAYPGGTEPNWYLFDVDTSGFVTLVDAGVFDTADAAASAWRDSVGEPGAVAVAVTTPAELSCLTQLDTGDEFAIRGDEPRAVLDEWYRVHDRISRLGRALRSRGLPLPAAASLYHDIDVEIMTAPFADWHRAEIGTAPDHEVVEALAGEWMEGALPETWFSTSPERIRFQRDLIGDWVPDDPVTVGVLALLPAWVRWLAERADLPVPLRERLAAEACPVPVSPT